jgi:endonuclease/exonuclease/phosphatase family metal-dependent hydrolase
MRVLGALLLVCTWTCDLPTTQPVPEPEPQPEPEPPVEPPPVQPPPAPLSADTVAAMTFNIFHDGRDDLRGIPPWDARRGIVLNTIASSRPDIVGLQEAYMWQADWLEGQLPDYDYVGRGREADGSGESVSVLFRTERFRLVESGHFWLSSTPDQPGSMGGASWGGMMVPRIVTWVRLAYTDSERELYVYNTHLPSDETGGREARRLGTILLADRIAARSRRDVPFILLGDFNSTESDFPLAYLERELQDPHSPVAVVDTWRQLNGTQQGTRCRNSSSGAPIVFGDRVDYVLVMDTTRVDRAGAQRSTADGILSSRSIEPTPSCGSDHVAVLSRFVVP